MKQTLKQGVSSHYRDKKLSETQLEKLQQLQAEADKATKQAKYSWFESSRQWVSKLLDYFYRGDKATSLKLSWSISALAVAFVLVIGIKASLLPSLDEKVVREIAYNHNKQAAMEIKSAALADIGNYLNKLDFSLINSERFSSPEWQLLGGRYCSIQGHLAAQLRIRNNETGKEMTLYQTQLPKQSPAISDGHLGYDAGVKVELWSEKGLVLGLAQSEIAQ